MKTNPHTHNLGYFMFLTGALGGFIFTLLATWADFEATNFDVSLSSDATLSSLRCPVLLAPQETGTVRASFDNPSERKLTRRVRLLVSHRLSSALQEKEFIAIPLFPREVQTLTWTVGDENLVWGRMILVRVWQNRNHPLPSRSSSCGVLVADVLGLSGSLFSVLAMAGSPAFMLTGFLLWKKYRRPNPGMSRWVADRELAMKALAVIVTAGILTTLLGQWMSGGILVVVAALLIVTVLGQSPVL